MYNYWHKTLNIKCQPKHIEGKTEKETVNKWYISNIIEQNQ